MELKPFGIDVIVIEPGAIRTEWGQIARCRKIVKAIQALRPKTRYAVGANAKLLVFMVTFLPDRFNDWLFGVITKTLLKQQRRQSATQAA
jgi:NAD(P)-dependent dehydrogenase (short-subunit alcohol dehydrogenase family)